jgi:hypothetical protein
VSEQRSRAPFIVLRVLWTCVSLHKLWDCLWSVGVLWLCKGNAPELPLWLWKCDSTVFVSFPFLVLYCPSVYIYCSGLGVSPQSHSLHCRLVASLFSLLIQSHSLHCSPLGALSLKGPLSRIFNNDRCTWWILRQAELPSWSARNWNPVYRNKMPVYWLTKMFNPWSIGSRIWGNEKCINLV